MLVLIRLAYAQRMCMCACVCASLCFLHLHFQNERKTEKNIVVVKKRKDTLLLQSCKLPDDYEQMIFIMYKKTLINVLYE